MFDVDIRTTGPELADLGKILSSRVYDEVMMKTPIAVLRLGDVNVLEYIASTSPPLAKELDKFFELLYRFPF